MSKLLIVIEIVKILSLIYNLLVDILTYMNEIFPNNFNYTFLDCITIAIDLAIFILLLILIKQITTVQKQ